MPDYVSKGCKDIFCEKIEKHSFGKFLTGSTKRKEVAG